MATIIKTNGEMVYDIKPKKGKYFQLKELQEIVGGSIELVYLPGSKIMVINEEGKLDNLPYNKNASFVADLKNDFIVGDVIIVDYNQLK